MILVDTSAWIFLFDRRRGGKESADAFYFHQSNKEQLAVTDLIVEETHKWLVHHAFPQETAANILRGFVQEDFANILLIEPTDRSEAATIICKYLDQKLSYTDALTVAIMKRLKIHKVFSFDTHFDLFPGIQRVP